jgi:hypothetical protein
MLAASNVKRVVTKLLTRDQIVLTVLNYMLTQYARRSDKVSRPHFGAKQQTPLRHTVHASHQCSHWITLFISNKTVWPGEVFPVNEMDHKCYTVKQQEVSSSGLLERLGYKIPRNSVILSSVLQERSDKYLRTGHDDFFQHPVSLHHVALPWNLEPQNLWGRISNLSNSKFTTWPSSRQTLYAVCTNTL